MASQLEMERRLVGDATGWVLMKEMWTIPGNRNRALISIGLMICQQMTGVNAIVRSSKPNPLSFPRGGLLTCRSVTELLRAPDLPEHGSGQHEIFSLRHRSLRNRKSSLIGTVGTSFSLTLRKTGEIRGLLPLHGLRSRQSWPEAQSPMG